MHDVNRWNFNEFSIVLHPPNVTYIHKLKVKLYSFIQNIVKEDTFVQIHKISAAFNVKL